MNDHRTESKSVTWILSTRGSDRKPTTRSSGIERIRRESRDFAFLGCDQGIEYLHPSGLDLNDRFEEHPNVATDSKVEHHVSVATFARRWLIPFLHGERPSDSARNFSEGWSEYRALNRHVAKELAARADGDDPVRAVVTSPLLAHVGLELNAMGVEADIALLLDTPFRAVAASPPQPCDPELAAGFSAFDEIGLLTQQDAWHLAAWLGQVHARVLCDGRSPQWWGEVGLAARQPVLRVIPPHPPSTEDWSASDVTWPPAHQAAVAIDPLLPHRQIARTLLGFERLLLKFDECRGAVTLEQVLLPPADDSDAGTSAQIQADVEHLAKLINERLGSEDWQPVRVRVAKTFEEQIRSIGHADILVCLTGGSANVGRAAMAWRQNDRLPPALAVTDPSDELVADEDPDGIDSVARAMLRAMSMTPAQRRAQYHQLATAHRLRL